MKRQYKRMKEKRLARRRVAITVFMILLSIFIVCLAIAVDAAQSVSGGFNGGL